VILDGRVTREAGLATSAALATAQADLDNPAQYKADVSALALEATAQSILADTAAIPSAEDVADQVWDEAIADHVVAGSTGKKLNDASAAGDPWAASVRTLTQTAQQIEDALEGSTITVHRGDELSASLTDLGAIPAGRTKFWFTVKEDPESEADTDAILQIEETAGLVYLNGAAATAAQALLASLTVDDEADGDVTIWISDSITAALGRTSGASYDFQYLDAGGEAHTLADGTFAVNVDVTRATSA
jgi:hypothetical protein